MNAVILPGNSLPHRQWASDLQIAVRDLFDAVNVHEYKHWTTGEEFIDLDHEAAVLPQTVQGLEPYVVFAKSAGVMLCLRSVHERSSAPSAGIFMGTPLFWAQQRGWDYDPWFKSSSLKSLFIHNDLDPVTHADAVKQYLKKCGMRNYQLVIWKGDNHNYDDWPTIVHLTDVFLNGKSTIQSA